MSIKTEYDENGNLHLVPTNPADDYVTIPLAQYEALMDHKKLLSNKERTVYVKQVPSLLWVAVCFAGWSVAAMSLAILYTILTLN